MLIIPIKCKHSRKSKCSNSFFSISQASSFHIHVITSFLPHARNILVDMGLSCKLFYPRLNFTFPTLHTLEIHHYCIPIMIISCIHSRRRNIEFNQFFSTNIYVVALQIKANIWAMRNTTVDNRSLSIFHFFRLQHECLMHPSHTSILCFTFGPRSNKITVHSNKTGAVKNSYLQKLNKIFIFIVSHSYR